MAADNPLPQEIWAFASGSNSPGKIVGVARAGIPPGVALLRWEGAWKWDCSADEHATPAAASCWLALRRVATELRIPVFVDTGAFAEMKAARPIPPAMWRRILDQQLAIARELGPLAVLVMPDKVGDQEATLRRLRRYRKQVRAILKTGARAIVVMQGGPRTDAEFAADVARTLGSRAWIVGFPTVRAKRDPEEIASALRSFPWRPSGAHLLGIGPSARLWPEYVGALRALPPGAWASSDAVLHRRLVGRAHTDVSGRVRAARPLTAQQDVARAQLREEAWGSAFDPLVGEMLDPTEQLPDPSPWLSRAAASEIARDGRRRGVLTAEEAELFARDPTAGRALVLARDDPGSEWWLDWHIEQEWLRRLDQLSTQMREARALEALLGPRAPSPRRPPEYGQLELGEEPMKKP